MDGHVDVLGYGSLVHPDALRSISGGASGKVGKGYGLRRVFNFVMDEQGYTRYEKSEDPLLCGCLNIEISEDKKDMVNGIVVDITQDNIDAFIAREAGYNLLPIQISIDGDEKSHSGYVLGLDESSAKYGKQLKKNDLLPNEDYFRVCYEGAREMGESFLNDWLGSTYLADGTNIQESHFFKTFCEKNGY